VTVEGRAGGLTEIDAPGLRPDNLLAFLALLGFLRAAACSSPETLVAASWPGPSRQCRLHCPTGTERARLVELVDAGLRQLGPVQLFEGKMDLSLTPREFRLEARSAAGNADRTLMLSALGSDGALRRSGKDEHIQPTPLCLMFGQGHQHFLQRLEDTFARADSVSETEARRDLERAVFEVWDYEDETESFRWDPMEDRRYALQYGDPSKGKNKVGTMSGANRLAAAGFALFTTAPRSRGLQMVAQAGSGSDTLICWPLPAVPTTLDGYRALLSHPALIDDSRAPELASYRVGAVARAKRAHVGKFLSIGIARIQALGTE